VSESSSDAASLSAVKVILCAVPKSEDSSSHAGEAENDEKKFGSVSVKVEPNEQSSSSSMLAAEESTASASCVKVKSEKLMHGAETVRLKVKDDDPDGEKSVELTEKQQPASEADVSDDAGKNNAVEHAVETAPQSDDCVSVNVIVSDVCQPDLQPVVKLEKVCSKTSVDSVVENDSCGAAAESPSVNIGNVDNVQHSDDKNDDVTASSSFYETSCQPVGSDNITQSADSQCEYQEQSITSKTDVAAAVQPKCSSPQKSKKLTSKQGTTPPESPGLWIMSYICVVKWL